nr:ribonuclease H-like domain-containing protein [Tanacetum cinerariifolium]
MTTPTVTSSTDSQMHNNIIAAGSRDHPPILETGRYPQWRSRFLRYIVTRPHGDALRKYILSGPYKPTTVLVQAVAATDDSLAFPEHTTVETPMNMSSENKAHFQAEKEAIHLIWTGIKDEIYSTVDACQTAQEMWEAIERLQQGESLNIQDVKTNLFWEFGKVIAKPITTPSETASEEDSDPEQAQRDKDMQKNLALITKKPKRVKDSGYHKEKCFCANKISKLHGKIQEVPTADSCANSESLEQNDQNDVESDDERVVLANLKLDTEFKKYKAFNDRIVDYDQLKRKLNETLGQLAQKDIEIKEGLETKAYEISGVKEKHDDLIKQSLLTKSHYEGLVKQKTKVIEFRDSYVVPVSAASAKTTDTTSDGTSKKKGRTVTVTVDDMQKRKNDVKARTTLLLSLPDEHQLRFTKHSRGNEDVTTASVSTASTNILTASTNVRVASISQDTDCAYIASQSSCSQIKFEDINQIVEDDIEEMDIKWNMALLSMRADKFWKKKGKKISIQGTDVVRFDKSKVECFNCHKMGYFARECRAPRSQDRGRRDNYRQGSKVKEQAPKALMAIEREGWD